jgi:hypothetical protein
MPIVFTKPEVIPEIRPNPSPSLNDVQNMINYVLERQVKSTDELLRRLIEERDGENRMLLILIHLLLLALLVSLKLIHIQVVYRWAAHQCQTPLPSRWITSTAEPPSRVRFLILGCHNKLRLVCMGKGIHTPHLALLYQTLLWPLIPPGLMVKHTLTLAVISKLRTPPYLTPTPSHNPVVGYASYLITPIKLHHVSIPTASWKQAALVMKLHHNSPLDHNQLTWCPLESQPSLAWTPTI